MPRDNEAPGGTRSLHRVELAAKLAVRDASATKGGMLSNFYEERTPKITRIVKRPGVEPAGTVGSGCGGQGFTEFNGSLLTVACDTLYKQHMVGLHAFVTLAKFPPGNTGAEGTGSNRYKLKFRPEQCGGEHVWSDPCDEDRESGEIVMDQVEGYVLMGVDINTEKVFTLNTSSGIFALVSPAITGIQAVASGSTTYGVAVGSDLKIYNKAWGLVTTVATGAVVTDVVYLSPYYYVVQGTNIKQYTEAGVIGGTLAVTSSMDYLGTDNAGFVYCIGEDTASEDWYNVDKISPTPAVVAGDNRNAGDVLNSAIGTACNVSATSSNVYAYIQYQDATFTNRPYLVKYNTSMVEQSFVNLESLFTGAWSGRFKIATTVDKVWAANFVNSSMKFFGLNLSTMVLETTYSSTSIVCGETLHRDYYA